MGAGPAGLVGRGLHGTLPPLHPRPRRGDGRWSYGQVNDNYLGFPGGVRARRLHALGRAQAERFGVEFRSALVTAIVARRGGYDAAHEQGQAHARTVIWAAGVRDRWPDFPGVRRLVGHRLFWCIVCDGWRTLGRSVLILGNRERAVSTALQFLTYTRDLTFLAEPGARLSTRCHRKLAGGRRGLPQGPHPPRRGHGGRDPARPPRGRLGRSRPTTSSACTAAIRAPSSCGAVPVALAPNGHVRTDEKNRTSLPTFFAAGDVTDRAQPPGGGGGARGGGGGDGGQPGAVPAPAAPLNDGLIPRPKRVMVRAAGAPPMSLRHPDLDAIARDLADLVSRGVSPDEPSIARAEDALRAARRAATGDWASRSAVDEAMASARSAIDEARDLLSLADERPAPRRRAEAQLELHSEIPDGHPGKSAIETAVAGAFAGVKGRWRVYDPGAGDVVVVGAAGRGRLDLLDGDPRRPRGAVAGLPRRAGPRGRAARPDAVGPGPLARAQLDTSSG